MIKEIAFTCYPVKDMSRARAFYEGLLGLKFVDAPSESGNWVEYIVGDDAFSIGKMDGFNPRSDGANLAFEVDDFDAMIKKLEDNKVVIKMGPMDTPVCHMAMIEDTEGNSLMIHRRKS